MQRLCMWPIFLKISGIKVHPGKSSFIFNLKTVAVINANYLRLIFNKSYISTKRVSSMCSPPGLTTFEE